jgi:hypothetical protein
MADSIVGGLFGVSPDMYSQARSARDYAQALKIGTSYAAPGTMMSPSLGPLYAQAAQTGQLLGQGVGGLLGVEDPELKKITAIQELSSQFDLTSPTGMRDFARSLQQIAPQEAMMAAKRADEMAVSSATVAQKTRERQIPTSPLGKLQFERQELLNAGVPANDPRVLAYDDAIKATGLTGKKAISAAAAPIERQNKLLGEKRVGKLLDLEDNALAATDTLQVVSDFRSLIDNSFTGAGAKAKLTAAQFANALGVPVTGTSESEQLNQLFAALTTGQAKNLKGSLSDKDLAFLKEAVGTSGLTKDTLRSVISRIERNALIEAKTFEIASKFEGDLAKMNIVDIKKQAQKEVNERADKQKRLEELRRKQNQPI